MRRGIVHLKWLTIGRRGSSVNRAVCRHRYTITSRASQHCFVSNDAMCARVRIVIAVLVLVAMVIVVAIVSLAISVVLAFITVHMRFAHIGICNSIRTLGLIIGIPRIYEYGFGVCLSIG